LASDAFPPPRSRTLLPPAQPPLHCPPTPPARATPCVSCPLLRPSFPLAVGALPTRPGRPPGFAPYVALGSLSPSLRAPAVSDACAAHPSKKNKSLSWSVSGCRNLTQRRWSRCRAAAAEGRGRLQGCQSERAGSLCLLSVLCAEHGARCQAQSSLGLHRTPQPSVKTERDCERDSAGAGERVSRWLDEQVSCCTLQTAVPHLHEAGRGAPGYW